jgi:alanine-glyoxylate transaminase/serine-glyoxylate transaminase/serine-pyruvate transaminase
MRIQKHRLLMIPGPTEISYEALLAMAQPSIVHYGDDFVERYRHVQTCLQQIFQTKNTVYLIPGSSSIAMEAAVSAALEPGQKILIPGSGMWGERFAEMARNCGGQVVFLASEWCQPVLADQVAKALDKDPQIRVMAAIHNETSMGMTNPAAELAEVCRERDVTLILDTVTSMGGINVSTDAWQLDYCLTGNHKCLEAPSGTGLIAVSERSWREMKARKTPVPGWFLNLQNIKDYSDRWSEWHPTGPVSPPTHVIAGLEVALDRVLAEGLENRFQRHARCARAMRAGLRAMGIELLVEDKYASNTVTAFKIPEGAKDKETRKIIEQQFDIVIAGSHHPKLVGQMLRIGHMGMTADLNCLVQVLVALGEALRIQKVRADIGQGVEGLLSTFNETKPEAGQSS